MKKIILPLFLTLFCLFIAQGQTQVFNGKSAKLTILTEYSGSWPIQLTQNKKYLLVSAMSADAGLIYNLEDQTVATMIPTAQPTGMSDNPATYVANINYDDGASDIYAQGFLIRNGERVELENLKHGTLGGGDVAGISADASLIVAVSDTTFADKTRTYFGGLWDHNGKFVTTLPSAWDNGLKFGTRPYGMSPNGRIIYGWAGFPNIAQRSPIYWIDQKAYTPADLQKNQGTFYGCNQNLMAIVGTLAGSGIICYHGEDGTMQKQLIAPLPGLNDCSFQGISNDSLVVGYSSLDHGTREAVIHTPKQGLVPLKNYLHELYGLDLESQTLLQACLISEDGKFIVGYTPAASIRDYAVFYVELGTQILPIPKNVTAVQARNTTQVAIRWNEPMNNGEKVLGYNVYLDGFATENKLNPNPITDLRYTTLSLEPGAHTFYVKTLYQNSGESDTSKGVKISVIGGGECYPILSIDHTVTFNDLVSLHWDLPSSQAAKKGKLAPLESKSVHIGPSGEPSTGYDFIKSYDLGNQQLSLTRMGDFYYTVANASTQINQYDLQFNLISSLTIPDLPSLSNLTAGPAGPNQRLYLVTGFNNYLYIVDPINKSIEDYMPIEIENIEKLTHITYIPEINEGKGGFEIGDYTKSFFIDLKGKLLGEGFTSVTNIMGSAYKDSIFYTFELEEENYCVLNSYNLKSKKKISTYNLMADPYVYQLMAPKTKAEEDNIAAAGGLTLSEMEDGTLSLSCILQGMYVTNHVVFVELKASSILGYNLYRNGEKLNSKPLQRRTYYDHPEQAGTYTYRVEAINNNGCYSDTNAASTLVELKPRGNCQAVNNLSVTENDSSINLSFQLPESGADGVVGFNLYRNDSLLTELWPYFRYQDMKPGQGKYTYRVESFYSTGCAASDSVTLEVNWQGKTQAPSLLRAKAEKKSNASHVYPIQVDWNLPYFEDPTEARYGLGVCGFQFALPNVTEYAAFIGWNKEKLAHYNDYVLLGLQVFMTAEVTSFQSIVLLNEKKVYDKMEGRIKTGVFHNLYFDSVFSMNQPISVEVGYQISFKEGTQPSGLDVTPAETGYGDIFTLDFQQFGYLKKDANTNRNWCMAGLIARYRDLEKAGKNWQKDSDFLSKIKTTKISSKDHVLKGFNLYRDDKKLNGDLLTNFTFADAASTGTYDYTVGAVYASGEEVKSLPITLEVGDVANEEISKTHHISFYPNPAISQIQIHGEYESLSLLDLNGKTLRQWNERADVVSLSGLAKGQYLLHFTLDNKQTEIHKLIIR